MKLELSLNLPSRGGLGRYTANGIPPSLVADFESGFYFNGETTTFPGILTSARAGIAMQYDGSVLRTSPNNLVAYSNEPENWANKQSVTVSENTITAVAATSAHRIYRGSITSVSGQEYTYDFYVTPGTHDYIQIHDGTSASYWANFDLGAVATGTVTGCTASITLTDDGDYRCRMVLTAAATTLIPVLALVSSSTSARNESWLAAGTETVICNDSRVFRSDVPPLADVPEDERTRSDLTFLRNITANPRYLPRRSHVSPTSGRTGTLIEAAATQLLHTTNALVTQSHTVTAVAHTLHFTGTGTVTLSGASTAGPLVGTGTGEANRVSLTFTPSAGSLTLTVSGTVTDAQLEVGSVPTSYIPNLAGSGTVTRAADNLYIPAATIPAYTTALSMSLEGEVSYADNEVTTRIVRWLDGAAYIITDLSTNGASVGQVVFQQDDGVTDDIVSSAADAYTPGVNVPFSVASRHGSTFINGAVDGVALTENSTPTALADLSGADLYLAYSGGPMLLHMFRLWVEDISDAGIAEASA